MLTVREAYAIAKNRQKQGDFLFACIDAVDVWGFAFVNRPFASGERVGGAYTAVNKLTGELSTLHPVHDYKKIRAAQKIPNEYFSVVAHRLRQLTA
jgi:hypothetical protein